MRTTAIIIWSSYLALILFIVVYIQFVTLDIFEMNIFPVIAGGFLWCLSPPLIYLVLILSTKKYNKGEGYPILIGLAFAGFGIPTFSLMFFGWYVLYASLIIFPLVLIYSGIVIFSNKGKFGS